MRKPRVCFVFRGKDGRVMGGAETSMLRMMRSAHPETIDCQVCFYRKPLYIFKAELEKADIPNWTAKSIFAYYRRLRELKPDVVYLFARIPYLAMWGLFAKLAGVACVIGAERGSASTKFDWISIKSSRIFLDGYIANSKSAQKNILKAGVSEQKIWVVYNGIELEPNPSRDDLSEVKFGYPSVLCVANILVQKGHKVLLHALKSLREKYPEARAVLIGYDYSSGSFFSEAEAEGLSSTYTWTGGVRNVRDYLRKATVFALPSLWGEGTPTTILEAMLMGLPVIASDTGGISELVIHGETGLLVLPGKPDDLCKAIDQIISSPDLARSLTENAHKMVNEKFTLASMVAGHLNAFHRLLDKS